MPRDWPLPSPPLPLPPRSQCLVTSAYIGPSWAAPCRAMAIPIQSRANTDASADAGDGDGDGDWDWAGRDGY